MTHAWLGTVNRTYSVHEHVAYVYVCAEHSLYMPGWLSHSTLHHSLYARRVILFQNHSSLSLLLPHPYPFISWKQQKDTGKHKTIYLKDMVFKNPLEGLLVAQWLRIHAGELELGLIPGQGLKIPHTAEQLSPGAASTEPKLQVHVPSVRSYLDATETCCSQINSFINNWFLKHIHWFKDRYYRTHTLHSTVWFIEEKTVF